MFVHINIGSNENKEENIKRAVAILEQKFNNIDKSSIYTSKAVGFKGNDFDNIGVNIDTTLSVEEVTSILREVENTIGRDRTKPKFSSRTIDLDLIFYGDQIIPELNIPREDILKYDFVLKPFMELITRRK